MSVTSTNLIQGPATLYFGAFGVTEPAEIDTVPGAGWTDLGGTKDGVALAVADEWSVLAVDQVPYEVERRRVNRVLTIKTQLAEATLDNLARAWNNTAPVDNDLVLDDDALVFNPAYCAILLDGIAPGGLPRRVILRKGLSTDSVESAYKKDGMTLVPATFTGHWVSPSIKPLRIYETPEA